MPMFMPELGIAWADPKPERLCQFPECPYKSKGYDGHKMKMCSKCQDVRYCVSAFTLYLKYWLIQVLEQGLPAIRLEIS